MCSPTLPKWDDCPGDSGVYIHRVPDDSSRSQYQSRLEHDQDGKKYWSNPPAS